jgi:hypothetical protein
MKHNVIENYYLLLLWRWFDISPCRGGLHTCAYTFITRKNIFFLVKTYPKLHRPAVYATVDTTVGCIKYGWLLSLQRAYYCQFSDRGWGKSRFIINISIYIHRTKKSVYPFEIGECYSAAVCIFYYKNVAFFKIPKSFKFILVIW